MNNINRKLREARFDKNMTITQLANAAGVSRPTIFKAEMRKDENLNFATMIKICNALGKTVQEIFL